MAAEVLEDRTLLSATFLDQQDGAIQLTVTQSLADEVVTISESGSSYLFVLLSGVWSGKDSAALHGAGTDTLAVQKEHAADADGKLVLRSDSDVLLDTANFHTLDSLVVTAKTITQNSGETLQVQDALLTAESIELSGRILGTGQLLHVVAAHELSLESAIVSTTTSSVKLIVGRLLGLWNGRTTGMSVEGSHIETQTGTIELTGWGATAALPPGSDQTASGVRISGSRIVSHGVGELSGSISVKGFSDNGRGAVGLVARESIIASTSALIRLQGNEASNSFTGGGTGIVLDDTLVRSLAGGIEIRGASHGGLESAAGVILSGTSLIAARGAGSEARDVLIVGVGFERGIDIRGSSGVLPAIVTTDGDVQLVGLTLSARSSITSQSGAAVALGGRIETRDTGSVTVVARTTLTSIGQAGSEGAGFRFGAPSAATSRVGTAGIYAFSSGRIAVVADSMELNGGLLWNPNGSITLTTASPERLIFLGERYQDRPSLALSDSELNHVLARVLTVGDVKQKAGIVIFGAVDHRSANGSTTLAIVSAGALADYPPHFTGSIRIGRLQADRLVTRVASVDLRDLTINSISGSATTLFTVANDKSLIIGSLAAREIAISARGTVRIAPGATLDTSRFRFTTNPQPPKRPNGFFGSNQPAPEGSIAQTPLLIRNHSDSPIVGEFAGLPEGALITTVAGRPVRITYRASVDFGMNGALIELHVQPFARADEFKVAENDILSGNLLVNDIDYGNGPLRVRAVDGSAARVGTEIRLGSGALLRVEQDGTLSYDPNHAFDHLGARERAIETFTYTVTDIYGGTWTATVRIVVTGAGQQDLIGFNRGGWYVGVSNGASLNTSAWAGWSDAAWDSLQKGDFNDDGNTDVLGLLDGAWYVGVSTGSAFATSMWAAWSNVDWQDVLVGDLNEDGRDDILARAGGNWWGALSDGSKFLPPALWATWGDLPWDYVAIGTASESFLTTPRPALFGMIDGEWWISVSTPQLNKFQGATRVLPPLGTDVDEVRLLDYDGNGRSDMAVLLDEQWRVSTSTGSSGFGTWFDWEKADWLDVCIGDFDGDGADDIAGRAGGNWWVSRYYEGRFLTTRWAMWSDFDWQDITVGDFNGDGSDDIAGRYAGEWWIGISTGTSFVTTLWATWIEQGWSAVFAGDVNGIPAASEATFSSSNRSNLVANSHFISGSRVENGMLSEASRALATLAREPFTPAAEIPQPHFRPRSQSKATDSPRGENDRDSIAAEAWLDEDSGIDLIDQLLVSL